MVITENPNFQKRKENAKMLASGYSWKKRCLEYFAVSAFTISWFNLFIIVARQFVHGTGPQLHLSALIFCVFLGLLAADLASGLAHWALDTWGNTQTPIFGPFIRSFREHHVDQCAITRHDFIETNGDSCLVVTPIILMATFLHTGTVLSTGVAAYVIALGVAVAYTNQIHKWSHQASQPPFVRVLMNLGIILSPAVHRVHHRGAHDEYYCITTGWLNRPLNAIDFWRRMECAIQRIFGAVPRQDDQELMVQTEAVPKESLPVRGK
jgi:ubiquitin-conjugating enzyme E2 variant